MTKLCEDWIVGFVDGEGCFSYSLIKNETLRFGYQIQGEFTVVQQKRDIQILYKLKDHFKCGSVHINHGDRYHFRVKNLEHFINIIIPFFEKHKLKTVKRFQVPVFKEISFRLKNRNHFEKEGFEEIKQLVQELKDLKKIDS